MDELLSTKALAKRWGVDPCNIRRAFVAGKLPAPVPKRPGLRGRHWKVIAIVAFERYGLFAWQLEAIENDY